MDVIVSFLIHKLPAVFLIVGLSLILARRKKTENANLHYLWVVVVAAGVLAVAEFGEMYINMEPKLVLLRTILSAIGYCMRSQCLLGLLLAVATNDRARRRYWIPQFILNATMIAALIPPVGKYVFYFKDDVEFQRGPLCYIAFIVPLIYILCLLYQAGRRFHDHSTREGKFLLMCLGFGIIEATIEVLYSGGNLETVLLIAALLFYVFIRFQDTDRDPLTGLKNRAVYYEDRDRYNDIITAVAFIDLNGLKRINDTVGHDEGDRALAVVGDALQSVSTKDVHAYRIGGDEFVLSFIGESEQAVQKILARARKIIHRQGLSVAAGYAVRTVANETARDLAHDADRMMYKDKDAYYEERQYERRIGE